MAYHRMGGGGRPGGFFCSGVVPVSVFCARVSVQAEMASRRWQRSPSGWVEVDVECRLRLASASISPPMAPSRSTEGRLICLAWTLRAGIADRLGVRVLCARAWVTASTRLLRAKRKGLLDQI